MENKLGIIDIEELPSEYKDLGDEYITCRIFRWMIGYFYKGMTRCGRCSRRRADCPAV